MDERVIALTDLTKQYGRFTAVDRICLTIRKGEIFGLLGPNGAGKSTTILMMPGRVDTANLHRAGSGFRQPQHHQAGS